MENKAFVNDGGDAGADAAMTGVMNAMGQDGQFSHK